MPQNLAKLWSISLHFRADVYTTSHSLDVNVTLYKSWYCSDVNATFCHDVASTLMRCISYFVASTLTRCCTNVMCPLGIRCAGREIGRHSICIPRKMAEILPSWPSPLKRIHLMLQIVTRQHCFKTIVLFDHHRVDHGSSVTLVFKTV